MRQRPPESAVVVRRAFVSTLRTATLAAGTTDCCSSTTVPCIDPVVDWASTDVARRGIARKTAARPHFRIRFFIETLLCPARPAAEPIQASRCDGNLHTSLQQERLFHKGNLYVWWWWPGTESNRRHADFQSAA